MLDDRAVLHKSHLSKFRVQHAAIIVGSETIMYLDS